MKNTTTSNHCPRCHTIALIEHIHQAKKVAKCIRCHALFSIKRIHPFKLDTFTEVLKTKSPSQLKIEERGDHLLIQLSANKFSNVGINYEKIVVTFLGYSLLVLLGILGFLKQYPPGFLSYLVVFSFGIGLWYILFNWPTFLNELDCFELTPASMIIFKDKGKGKINPIEIKRTEIAQLYSSTTKKEKIKKKEPYESVSYILAYSLYLHDKQYRRYTLVENFPSRQPLLYLEKLMEAYYQIPDISLKEELN